MPNQKQLLLAMIEYLQSENLTDVDDLRTTDLQTVWRGLVNQQDPQNISQEYLSLEDRYLSHWWNTQKVKTIDVCHQTVYSNVFTYHGDICLLQVDAIVNAANSKLLGCFIPNHHCIDNHINTFAGSRLRLACHQLMTQQGRMEAVGQAKLTESYHLPCKYVIHTVGPYVKVDQKPSRIREDLLKSSYKSCLQLAVRANLKTIVFPCISTGEFGFPNQRAAELAVQAILEWQRENQHKLYIIFNTFTPKDQEIYQKLLLKEEIDDSVEDSRKN
ncbi:TPA: protein-ADP-ribose hydrolase [Streptococcus agalactiae]